MLKDNKCWRIWPCQGGQEAISELKKNVCLLGEGWKRVMRSNTGRRKRVIKEFLWEKSIKQEDEFWRGKKTCSWIRTCKPLEDNLKRQFYQLHNEKLLKRGVIAAAAAAAKSLQLCPTLRDPIDGSPLGSPIPEILQAGTLEWVAISFSNVWKWKVKVKSLSRVRLFATPWTAAHQPPPSMGFSRQEYWSGVPLPSPGGDWEGGKIRSVL